MIVFARQTPARQRGAAMSLISVPAVYDGNEVRLLESVSVEGPYRVVVTFLEPLPEAARKPPDADSFWASFGAWQDDRPVADTLRDIYQARQTRHEPLQL
jgi:hypothetical protein